MTFMFESATQDRVSDFELKLMDIDSEQCVLFSSCMQSSVPCMYTLAKRL